MTDRLDITAEPLSDTAIAALATLLLELGEPTEQQQSPSETASGSTPPRATRCQNLNARPTE